MCLDDDYLSQRHLRSLGLLGMRGELARKSKRLKLISLYSVKAQSFEMTYCHDLSDVLGEGKWIV